MLRLAVGEDDDAKPASACLSNWKYSVVFISPHITTLRVITG